MNAPEDRADLRRVGQDVAVGQDDRLGLAHAAAGEEKRGFLAVADLGHVRSSGARPGAEPATRSAPALQAGGGKAFAQGGEVDAVLEPGKILDLVDHGGSGDQALDAGAGDGRLVGRATGGKIQIHRDFAGEDTPRLAMVAPGSAGRTMPIRFSGTFFRSQNDEGDPHRQQLAAGQRAVAGMGVEMHGGEEFFAQTAQALVADVRAQFGPRPEGGLRQIVEGRRTTSGEASVAGIGAPK